jgi:hypothetical protein
VTLTGGGDVVVDLGADNLPAPTFGDRFGVFPLPVDGGAFTSFVE